VREGAARRRLHPLRVSQQSRSRFPLVVAVGLAAPSVTRRPRHARTQAAQAACPSAACATTTPLLPPLAPPRADALDGSGSGSAGGSNGTSGAAPVPNNTSRRQVLVAAAPAPAPDGKPRLGRPPSQHLQVCQVRARTWRSVCIRAEKKNGDNGTQPATRMRVRRARRADLRVRRARASRRWPTASTRARR
jgi:hypothetical protein